MDHRKEIKEVGTIISKGKMRICLTVEDFDQPIYLSFRQIKRVVDIPVTELELLTGSELEFSFYKPGETMGNGKIYQKGFYKMIKHFRIHLLDAIENLKKINHHLQKDFSEIIEVFTFIKRNRVNVGIKTKDSHKVFLTTNMLSQLTKLQIQDYDLLKRAYISPVFHKKGEITFTGSTCWKDDTLVKNLNLRYPIDFNLPEEVLSAHEGPISIEIERQLPYYLEQQEMEELYRQKSCSEPYSLGDERFGDWLIDAAGTDDPETMNAVYWNLD